MYEEVAFSGKRAYRKQIMPVFSSFIALCSWPCCYISSNYTFFSPMSRDYLGIEIAVQYQASLPSVPDKEWHPDEMKLSPNRSGSHESVLPGYRNREFTPD